MLVTYISIAVITAAFLYFIFVATKLRIGKSVINKALASNDPLSELNKDKRLNQLVTLYNKSIVVSVGKEKKSNVPASEYFTEASVGKAFSLNLRMLDAASGTLVGMGLLGTFLGLTIGIMGFKSDNTENIQNSIQSLLSGMGTAFFTSLVGMGLSLIYTVFFDKPWKNMYSRAVYDLGEKLDQLYYIDDLALMKIQQTEMFVNLASKLESQLTYTNESGVVVPIANAIREILRESSEQSRALKSFSTDLALELNQGFDETLSRQMQEKIVPLMENIDSTTKVVIEHIDKMSENVASPATDMIQNVVNELKTSMSAIMKEFSQGLSGSATNQLENLALQLGSAAQSMADFPKNMENISATLQVTIEEVKSAISEITNSSAISNESAMKQMQEQITFATTSMSNAINEVKEVMAGLTHSSEESSNQMISKLADAANKMGTFLDSTISNLSSSVQESVKNIAADVNDKQANLLALQEDTTTQTKRLLDSFNTGLERLEKMNEYIAGTMNEFQQAQGHVLNCAINLRAITNDMKLATEVFTKGQSDYSAKMYELQNVSNQNMDRIAELLKNTGDMSDEYIEKFDTIRTGLSAIFGQIQSGLTEYSMTVQSTTQKYLDQYSTSLTNTTDALSSTIQQQNEVVEMLVDALNTRKS